MVTVAIDNRYVELFNILGGIQESADLAMQRFVVEQITSKIADLKRQDAVFAKKYGMNYDLFLKNLESVEFVKKTEATITKTWEEHLIDWEFCHKGVGDWTRELQGVLLG